MKKINKKYIKKFHLILFFYGLIITALTVYFDYNFTKQQVVEQLISEEGRELESLNAEVSLFSNNIKNILSSIESNILFKRYLESNNSPARLKDAEALFLNSIQGRDDIFKLRYIDLNGFEVIKSFRERNNNSAQLTTKQYLQNKSNRYYFKQTINLNSNDFWHSPLDLNVEYGKLETPIRPTWRVAKPVFHNGVKKGIVVINIEMKELLSHLMLNAHSFNLYITDNNGIIITDPLDKHPFSKFTNEPFSILKSLPNLFKNVLEEGVNLDYVSVMKKLHLPSSNGSDLFFVILPKSSILQNLNNAAIKRVLEFGVYIIFISAILSLVLAIPTSRLHQELISAQEDKEKHIKQIEHIARTDQLTQLGNRYAIDEKFDSCRALHDRYNIPLSGLLLDIDYFKKINDKYGHLIGDHVLKSISILLQQNIRETDFIGRWGGEEFIILCEDTDIDGAKELAFKLNKIISEYDFGDIPQQTISIGVAQYLDIDNMKSFLKQLDDRVYKAKNSGRNCVIFS